MSEAQVTGVTWASDMWSERRERGQYPVAVGSG